MAINQSNPPAKELRVRLLKFMAFLVINSLSISLFLHLHGSSWLELLDFPALLFVSAGLAMSLASHPLSDVLRAWNQALGRSQDTDSLATSQLVFETMARYTLLAGLLGTLLNVIGSLAEPQEMRGLALSLAVSLCSLIYALLLRRLVLAPMQISLARQAEFQEV